MSIFMVVLFLRGRRVVYGLGISNNFQIITRKKSTDLVVKILLHKIRFHKSNQLLEYYTCDYKSQSLYRNYRKVLKILRNGKKK